MNKVVSIKDTFNPKELIDHYFFVVRENNVGGGFQEVIHAEDVQLYDSQHAMSDSLRNTLRTLNESLNHERYQLREFYVADQKGLTAQDINQNQIDIWAEKLDMPKKYLIDRIDVTPQTLKRHFRFIVKESSGGGGFQEILYGLDISKFDSFEDANVPFGNKRDEIENSLDESKYRLAEISVANQREMAAQGIDQDDIAEWAGKLGIPKDYPPKP